MGEKQKKPPKKETKKITLNLGSRDFQNFLEAIDDKASKQQRFQEKKNE